MEFDKVLDPHKTITYEAKSKWHKFWGMSKRKSITIFYPATRVSETRHYDEKGSVFLIDNKNKEGELHGERWKRCDDQEEQATYENGKKEGHYHVDVYFGSVGPRNFAYRRSGQYKHDRKVGKWTDTLSGPVVRSESYYKDDGSELGFKIRYDKNGKPEDFAALQGVTEIRMIENGFSIINSTIGIEQRPLEMEAVCDAIVEAYEIHEKAKEFMVETMQEKLGAIETDYATTKQELTDKHLEVCGDLQMKLNLENADFVEQKQELVNNKYKQKDNVSTVFKLAGLEPLSPDA